MEYPTLTFPNENINYLTPSWADMNQLAFKIAKQAIAQNSQFDRIITLAKGGWPLTRSLVDFLDVKEVASIGVKFYAGINKRLSKPQIYQDIPVNIAGEKVLLFDDVADTGESLKFVQSYLLKKGVAAVQTAALFYKPHSVLKPDFYGAETSAWIIFPYDLVDSIKILGKKWLDQGLKKEALVERFLKLNFKAEWLDFYLKQTFNI